MKRFLMMASLALVAAFGVMGTAGAGIASAGNCTLIQNQDPHMSGSDTFLDDMWAQNCTGVSGVRITLEHWWNSSGQNYTSTLYAADIASSGTKANFDPQYWTDCRNWMPQVGAWVANTVDYSIRSWPGQTWGPTHTSNQGGGVPEFCPA